MVLVKNGHTDPLPFDFPQIRLSLSHDALLRFTFNFFLSAVAVMLPVLLVNLTCLNNLQD